jgi:hypothetical protein
VRPLKLTLIVVFLLAVSAPATGAASAPYGQFQCSSNWKYCSAISGSSHDPVLYFNSYTNKKVVGCLRTSEAHWLCRSFKPVRDESIPGDAEAVYYVKRHMRSAYPYTGEGQYKMIWKRNDKKLMPGLNFWVD